MEKLDEQLLVECVRGGDINAVISLLDGGANIEAKTRDGNTPLIKASWNGHTEIVKLLLDRNADINVANKYGCTSLIKASGEGCYDIAKLLLEGVLNNFLFNIYDRLTIDGTTPSPSIPST